MIQYKQKYKIWNICFGESLIRFEDLQILFFDIVQHY
jgi:hypothetical protein